MESICGKCGHWRDSGTLTRCPRCGAKLCSTCHMEHSDECDASGPFELTTNRLTTIQEAFKETADFIEGIQDGDEYSSRQFADCLVQIREAALIAEAAYLTVKRCEADQIEQEPAEPVGSNDYVMGLVLGSPWVPVERKIA